MCIGLASGYRMQDGDKYELKLYGKRYPYVIKKTPNGFVAVHNSKTPLGPPLAAMPVAEMSKCDFERVM